MKKRYGYTLIELLVVIFVFGTLLSVIFGTMAQLRSSWEGGDMQIDRQQQARKGVDKIAWELRVANPSWEIASNLYNISINSFGDQIDFYAPIFDSDNVVTGLTKVRYFIGGTDNNQLLRREGGSAATVVANNIDNVLGQKPFFSFNHVERTIIDIKIPVVRDGTTFILRSQANLRNRETELADDVVIEDIPIE